MPSPKKAMGLTAIFEKHRWGTNTTNSTRNRPLASLATKTPKELLIAELGHYECIPALSDDANPLQWWSGQQNTLPLLAKYARKYLAIPASSVPSERIFSRGGLIVTDNRVCLTGNNVEMLVMTSMNVDYL